MDILLINLCRRLPYRLTGKLDTGVDGELVGINLKDLENPIIDIRVLGYKTPWSCSYKLFKPYLKPLFPTIYEKQENGIVPWIEFKERWYKEGSERLGSTDIPSILNSLESFEFIERKGPKEKWRYFHGKIKQKDGRLTDDYECATFYHHLAFDVAYEEGIDVDGLIEQGLALEWKQ